MKNKWIRITALIIGLSFMLYLITMFLTGFIQGYEGARLKRLNSGLTVSQIPAPKKPVENSVAFYFDRASAKRGRKDEPGAKADFDLALKANPVSSSDYYARSFILLEKGETIRALADLNQSLKLNDKFADAYSARGTAKAKLGDLSGALKDYNQALGLNPGLENAYLGRGLIKRKQMDAKAAVEDFDEALWLNLNSVRAYASRGEAKLVLEDYAGALFDCDRALALSPSFTSVWVNRGVVKQRLGNRPGAEADFRRAIETDPKHLAGFKNLGFLKILHQEWNGALSDLRKYCSPINDRQDYARILIWMLLCRTGKATEANAELETYFFKEGRKETAAWPVEIASMLLGKISQKSLLELAAGASDPIVKDDQICEGWYYAGIKNLVEGDRGEAERCFQSCLVSGRKHFFETQAAASELKTHLH